jgi:Zn finger protein HypA/HybF involved in hydrogenase expression
MRKELGESFKPDAGINKEKRLCYSCRKELKTRRFSLFCKKCEKDPDRAKSKIFFLDGKR